MHDDHIPSKDQLYRRLKTKLLKVLPAMQGPFDFAEKIGGPARDDTISATKWFLLGAEMPKALYLV